MKQLLLLLLLPVAGLGQIPKNAEKIIVEGVSFQEVGDHLLDYGFLIETSDATFQTIETKMFQVKNFSGQSVMRIRVKDSCAIITGVYNIPFLTGPHIFTSMYAKSGKKPFESLNRFAISFKKPVRYEIYSK